MMTLPDDTAMWMPSETSMDLPQSPSTTQNSPSLERNSMNLVGEMDGDNRGKPVSEMDVPIIEEDGKDGADECILILASPEGPPCSPTLTLPSNFPILTSSKTNIDISRKSTTTENSPSLGVMVGENQGKGQESMSSKMGLPVIEKEGKDDIDECILITTLPKGPPRSLMLTSPSNTTLIPMSEIIMDPPQSSTISKNLPPLGGEINSEDEQKEIESMCPGLDLLHDTQEREHDVSENSAVPTSPENHLAMVLYESCTPVQMSSESTDSDPPQVAEPCLKGERSRGFTRRQDLSLDWQNVNPLLSGCFNPCTCHVFPGEDIVEKLKAFFAQLGGLSACVVDATGHVSTFHTRNLAQPDGILKLEGSFMLENINATYSFFELPLPRERMIRFSILVGDEHGTLIGGEVAGPLIAASPVQVVLCTFDQRNARESGMLGEARPSTASCSSSVDER